MSQDTIVIFGGSGFIGRHIVHSAVCSGFKVVVVCRCLQDITSLRTFVGSGLVKIIKGDAADVIGGGWSEHLLGAKLAVNATGSMISNGYQECLDTFVRTTETISAECSNYKTHILHISSLGAETNFSNIMRCKVMSEKAVLNCSAPKTIFKCSVVVGADNPIFSPYCTMSKVLPCVPFCGNPGIFLQPVSVEDLANAVIKVARLGLDCAGKTIGIVGPEVVSVEEVLNKICRNNGSKLWIVKQKAMKSIVSSITTSFPFFILHRLFAGVQDLKMTQELIELVSSGNYSLANNKPELMESISDLDITMNSTRELWSGDVDNLSSNE